VVGLTSEDDVTMYFYSLILECNFLGLWHRFMDNEKWEKRKRINVKGDAEIGNQVMRVKSSRNDFWFSTMC
jgi:hypothetical protein